MKITELRNSPPLLIISIFLLVLAIGKIPIKEYLVFSYSTSDKLETILISSILVCILIAIIHKLRIPHSYFSFIDRRTYIYYLPAIIYVFVFTNGFNDFLSMRYSTLNSAQISLYGAEAFSGALFEEILFRGLVFGVLLNKYYDSKNGILKSVLISSFIFGLAHIENIWTQPQISTRGTLNQVYATTCLGVMYCATYVKTRSVVVLSVLHFISNFSAGIGELAGSAIIIEPVSRHKTIIEIIASYMLIAVIYGSSLLIGLYILKHTTREEVEEFAGRS